MRQYTVTGMTCAACQSHVEKAVAEVPGVSSVAVALLTNSMAVDGTASDEEIIRAVENAGYGARLKGEEKKRSSASEKLAQEAEALADHETPKLKRRLIWSAVFLALLIYITMGHNMLGWPVPAFFDHNHLGLALTEMLLALIVMHVNKDFFLSGGKSLAHGAPNMDTLVALGSGVSFLWSLYVLYEMTYLLTQGTSNTDLMEIYHDRLYFESAAMIPALITVGKTLESLSKGRTTDALKSLMRMAPKTAFIEKNGQEVSVAIDEVQPGDIFVVRPGETIPVDGVIIEGAAAADESALTGESVPVDKAEGDTVKAATINRSGFIRARATRVGEDTTFSQIIRMVSDAAATKAPIARIADAVSAVFVPAVIGVAVLVMIVWILLGAPMAKALEYAICVLVISCPCALGLATPVAIMVGSGVGAKNGILFKTSESLENAGKIQIIALDKTGTVTEGKPEVTGIYPAEHMTDDELLLLAYSLERKSEHPLARAVVEKAEERGMSPKETSGFRVLAGNGLAAIMDGDTIHGGSETYISTLADIPQNMVDRSRALGEEGKMPIFFERNGIFLGIIAAADVIKEDSAQAVKELQHMGIEVIMLTGDNRRTADAIGKEAGVDRVIAGVLPDGKAAVIKNLQKRGRTAMVGDGINDAPALTGSDIGIAIGAGTDVAVDSADIVLMNSRLTDVSAAIRLSRKTLKNIRENLFWAFAYNILLIPVAAGVYPMISINPMWSAAAMALSSVTVCLNALRLNLFEVHDSGKDKPLKKKALLPAEVPGAETGTAIEKKEAAGKESAVIIAVEGMTCEMCEHHVENALKKIKGVVEAKADHTTGKVNMTCSADPDEETVKKAISEADYIYKGMIVPKEEMKMKETVRIEGMMCGHCEAAVKKSLEALDGVDRAEVSHETGTAVLTLSKEVADADVRKAVEDKDYKFVRIEK